MYSASVLDLAPGSVGTPAMSGALKKIPRTLMVAANKATCTDLDACGLTWTHLDAHGLTWTTIGSLGLTWFQMESHGLTWFQMDSHGLTWTHKDKRDDWHRGARRRE